MFGLRHRLEILTERLRRDGLAIRPLILMAYACIWLVPERPYREILEVYADYVGSVPERVQADLCYRLLAAGLEIGPEQYIRQIAGEERDADGIFA